MLLSPSKPWWHLTAVSATLLSPITNIPPPPPAEHQDSSSAIQLMKKPGTHTHKIDPPPPHKLTPLRMHRRTHLFMPPYISVHNRIKAFKHPCYENWSDRLMSHRCKVLFCQHARHNTPVRGDTHMSTQHVNRSVGIKGRLSVLSSTCVCHKKEKKLRMFLTDQTVAKWKQSNFLVSGLVRHIIRFSLQDYLW